MRFVLKSKFEPELLNRDFELFDGRKKRISDLVSHVDILKVDPMALKCVEETFKRNGLVESRDELLNYVSQLKVNCYAIGTSG